MEPMEEETAVVAALVGNPLVEVVGLPLEVVAVVLLELPVVDIKVTPALVVEVQEVAETPRRLSVKHFSITQQKRITLL